jgi:hypothetical protein
MSRAFSQGVGGRAWPWAFMIYKVLDLSPKVEFTLLFLLLKKRADEGGLFGIEDLPAGESIADEFEFVEGPDDLAVLVEFDDLRVFVASVAVANDDVSVGEFLKVGGPSEFDIGAGDFFGDFPDNFFVRGDFENGVAAAGGDEGVAALQADRSEDAGFGGVFPHDFSVSVIFGDDPGAFGAGKVVAVGEDLKHAGLMATVSRKGDFLDDLTGLIEVDDAAKTALGNHGVTVGEALEGVDVGALRVVLPNDFLFRGDLGSDGPRVVEEDVSVGEELEVVVAGVTAFGAFGIIFPDDGAVGFADGEKVFSVGGADEDEAVFFGEEGEGEQEEDGDELHELGLFIREVLWRSFAFLPGGWINHENHEKNEKVEGLG